MTGPPQVTSCKVLNPGSGFLYVTVLALYLIPTAPLSTRVPRESFQAELNLSQRSRSGNKHPGLLARGRGREVCCPDGQGPCLCSQCTDGLDGNGTCVCQDGFRGSRCQFCSDPSKYGPRCDKSKCRFQSCLPLLSQGPHGSVVQSWCWVPLGLVGAPTTGHFLSPWVPNASMCQVAEAPHRALR